ncbi:MAG: cadherin-like domain-containing protein, partial [Pseudomonadota bacterium]
MVGGNSGSAYIFDRDGTQVAKLVATDASGADSFGSKVAVSGDGSFVVVGSPGDDDTGSSSGSAYVFDRTGTQLAKLTASDAAGSDQFGAGLSMSDDGSVIVVGALADDDNGFNSGSAYIFSFNGTAANQVAKLTAPDGAANDLFGRDVVVSGDGATIIVGSAFDVDGAGSATGSAYVFDGNGNFVTKLTAPDAAQSDEFSFQALAVSADGSTIVVGAHRDDDQGNNSGSVYVFDRDGTVVAKLTAPDGALNDFFSRNGLDITADGNTIIVGATGSDSPFGNTGAAYVYSRDSSGAWTDDQGNAYGPTGVTGTSTGALAADIVTGQLTITDPDAGEDAAQAASGTATHGSFSVDASGAWEYILNNSDPTVQAMNANTTLTDSFVVTSADGSASETVEVTINAADGVEVFDSTGTVSRGTFATIQAGIDSAMAGDRVVVAAGTFNETLTIDKNILLLGAQTFTAVGGRTNPLNETIIVGANDVITVEDTAEFTTIDGFTIRATTASAVRVEAIATSLLNNIIENTHSATIGDGVLFAVSASGQAIGNDISGFQNGIRLFEDNDLAIVNGNIISDNDTGIVIRNASTQDTIGIQGNTFSGNTDAGVEVDSPANFASLDVFVPDSNDFSAQPAGVPDVTSSVAVGGSLSGSEHDDSVTGQNNSAELFLGDEGDDTFDGGTGTGTDTFRLFLKFPGDYQIEVTRTDLGSGESGLVTSYDTVTALNTALVDEGTNTLSNVERLSFDGVSFFTITDNAQVFDSSGNLIYSVNVISTSSSGVVNTLEQQVNSADGNVLVLRDGMVFPPNSEISITSNNIKIVNDTTESSVGITDLTFDDQGTGTSIVDASAAPLTLNTPPTDSDETFEIAEDSGLQTFDVLANADDADMDPLTVTIAPGDLPAASEGVASVNAQNEIEFTPTADFNGQVMIPYTVSDGQASVTSNLTINVTPVDDAPEGTDNTVTINEDAAHTLTASDFGFSDADGNGFDSVIISTLETDGALTLNGVDVTAGQTVGIGNINSGQLVFTPDANENGSNYANFTFQVVDDTENLWSQSNNASIVTETFQGQPERMLRVESGGFAGTFATEAPTIGGIYTLTFDVIDPLGEEPTNARSDVFVVTPSSGQNLFGRATSTLSNITTSSEQVQSLSVTTTNAAPGGFTNVRVFFQATPSGKPFFIDNVSLTLNGGDGTNLIANGDFEGEFAINTDLTPNTLTFDVESVADAPEGNDSTITINEDEAHTITANDFGFSDGDNDQFDGVIITTLESDGSLTLNGLDVTAGQTISATDIASDLLIFTPDVNENGNGYANFTFQVIDDSPAGVTDGEIPSFWSYQGTVDTITFEGAQEQVLSVSNNTVTAFTSPPTFSGDLYTLTFDVIDPLGVAVTDVEATVKTALTTGTHIEIQSVTSSLSVPSTTATEQRQTVTLTTTNPVSAPLGGGIPVFVEFSNTTPGQFFIDNVSLTLVGGDGTNLIHNGDFNAGVNTDLTPNTMTFDVTAVSDAPEGTDATITIDEDASHTLTANDFGFSDIDNDQFDGVIIRSLETDGALTLNGVDVTAGQTISATDIAADRLVFTPDGDENGSPYANFTFQVQDDSASDNTDLTANTITFEVTPMADAPQGSDTIIGINEDEAHTLTASDFGFSDVDNDNLDGVIITTLASEGLLRLNGVNVTAGQTISASDIAADRLVYTPDTDENGTPYTSFTFQVIDDSNAGLPDGWTGSNGGGSVTTITTVGGVQEDVLTGNNTQIESTATAPAIAGQSYTLTFDAFIVDANSANVFAQISVTDSGGFLSLGTATSTLTTGAGASAQRQTVTVTFNGLSPTVPPLYDGDSLNVTFVGSGPGNFYVDNVDLRQDGAGGPNLIDNGTFDVSPDTDQSPNTMTFNVLPVSDAPTGTDNLITINEDEAYTLTASDFGFADSEGDAFFSVLIPDDVTDGVLTLDGNDVNAGDVVLVNQIDAGLLVFTPDQDENGTSYSNFTFRVRDNGSTANGGEIEDQTLRTMTFDVTPVSRDELCREGCCSFAAEDDNYAQEIIMNSTDFHFL